MADCVVDAVRPAIERVSDATALVQRIFFAVGLGDGRLKHPRTLFHLAVAERQPDHCDRHSSAYELFSARME